MYGNALYGTLQSVVGFDTAKRRYGKMGEGGLGMALKSEDEMAAYLLSDQQHQPMIDVGIFRGLCADFDMDSWMGEESCFLVMLIMANGDDLPAGQLTNLAAWGLWNDGSAAARTLAAGDKLAFIGRNGLEQGIAFEYRVVTGEIAHSAMLVNGTML